MPEIRWCVGGSCTSFYQWIPAGWTGDINDNNPNPKCSGCAPVGVVNYHVPAYTTNYNYTTVLTPSSPQVERDTSRLASYGFNLDFAGFVSVNAQATYGNITSMVWNYKSTGCSAPNSRILWGNGYPPSQAPIEQANCFVRPAP